MRYIPHTPDEIKEMLSSIKLNDVKDLFASIPDNAKLSKPLALPPALSEPDLLRHIGAIASKNRQAGRNLSFLGAGSYHHYTPAAVSEIAGRSEWLTPYTPYQPEISQGTLQAIFEYQTMICNLTNMDVANASHYDGATATAEAALMAIQKTKKTKILLSSTLHPEYRATIKTVLGPKKKSIIEIPYLSDGSLNIDELKKNLNTDVAAFIVQTPNFFGVIEDLDKISKEILSSKALFIVTIAEPVSLGILKGPGEFGADIVTAEGQAFAGGLNFGGPYLGIFASREKYLRSMPGRIVGATKDQDGNRGFVLTMSTREQHIRRERATSNICSNEAHLALTAAIHLSLLGKVGIKKLAEINFSNSEYLKTELRKLDGVQIAFDGPTFNEFVIKVDLGADELCKRLLQKNIFAGVPLECWYPPLDNHLLVCTTECHNKDDIDKFVATLGHEVKK